MTGCRSTQRPSTPPDDRHAALDADRLAVAMVSQALAGAVDLDRLARRIVAVIARLGDATDVGLFLRRFVDLDAAGPPAHPAPASGLAPTLHDDPSQWTLVAVGRTGRPVMTTRESAAMAGLHGFAPSLVRHALDSRQAETIDDVGADPRLDRHVPALSHPAGSALVLPVRSAGRCDALLLIENRLITHAFTTDLMTTFELVAGQLSVALHDALLRRAMTRRLARTARARRHATDDVALRDRALAAATEAVSILDAKSDVFAAVWVNAAFEALTGYARDEVLGRSLHRLYGDDTAQPEIQTLRDAVRRGAPCHVTVRCYRRSGEMFWNEVSVAPIFDADGRASHHVCVNRDVTERRLQAADERLRSERLEAVFALSPDGVVVIDSDHRVTSVNPAFESLTGLYEAELRGMAASELDARLAARTQGGRVAPWLSEQPVVMRLVDPGPRTLLRHTRRGLNSGQDTVLYFRDVTQEFEVDRMKSGLLAAVAQALRTPTTHLSGATELLLDRRLKAALRIETLEVIHQRTAALTARLDELLDRARAEDGDAGETTSCSTAPAMPPLAAPEADTAAANEPSPGASP